jgi:hypothetical protein
MKGMKIYTRKQLYPVCMSLNASRDSETDVGILKMVQRVGICQPFEIQKQLLKFVKLCPWTIG